MPTLTVRHGIQTIDKKLLESGFTVTRDHYTETNFTLNKQADLLVLAAAFDNGDAGTGMAAEQLIHSED